MVCPAIRRNREMRWRNSAVHLLRDPVPLLMQAYRSALYAGLCNRINRLPEGWESFPLLMSELAEASELARLEVTNLPEVGWHNSCATAAAQ